MSSKFGSASAPADEAAAVTTDDTALLSPVSRSLYIGGAGDVSVDMATTGAAIVYKAVPVGTILPIAVKRVRATGTTATNIVALY